MKSLIIFAGLEKSHVYAQSSKLACGHFFASLSVLFFTSVTIFDRYLLNFTKMLRVPMSMPLDPAVPGIYNIYQILYPLRELIEKLQYLDIVVFLLVSIMLLWQKLSLPRTLIFILSGTLTLFTVLILSIFRSYISVGLPVTGEGNSSLAEKIPLYVSALSGLIAAISGLIAQITASRKASRDIELEKLRLQLEQKKLRAEAERKKAKETEKGKATKTQKNSST